MGSEDLWFRQFKNTVMRFKHYGGSGGTMNVETGGHSGGTAKYEGVKNTVF